MLRSVIPDFQTIMRPMLEVLSDGKDRDTATLRDELAEAFGVTADERAELLPKGSGRLYDNRVAWAYVHLQHAGAIERVARGVYRVTPRGLKLLAENPERIDNKVLSQFPELVAFRKGSKGKRRKAEVAAETEALNEDKSPVERMALARADHEAELSLAIRERIDSSDPVFFERLVLKVLLAMGYGGSEEEAAQHLGGAGDGGVDGVIYEDKLGLDRIYVQAKRYTQGGVSRSEIQAFEGAIGGRGANKGVFITASHFSKDAQDWAEQSARRNIVLIDGARLAELMIRFDVGVTTLDRYAVQELDDAFFQDELG